MAMLIPLNALAAIMLAGAELKPIAESTSFLSVVLGMAALVNGVLLAGGIWGVAKHCNNAKKHLRENGGYVTEGQYSQCHSEMRTDVTILRNDIGTVHERINTLQKSQNESTEKILLAIAGLTGK